MTLAHAIDALCGVLDAENAALGALDLPGACALLPAKQHAVAAFAAAQAASPASPALAAAAYRLKRATDDNRRLLQQAMAAQTHVLGVLAGAAQRSQAAPRYGRGGALAAGARTAWALSARA